MVSCLFDNLSNKKYDFKLFLHQTLFYHKVIILC